MERKYLILSLLTVFAILTASCRREDYPAYQDGEGGVEFSISSQWTDTKADARDANINLDDFKVELINSSGVIFKRWKKYSDYKSQEDQTVLLNAGSRYTLRATYGDSTAVGFDAFFFMGDTTFTVPPQTTLTLDVVCKQANVEVAVAYGEVLKAEYTNYHATVKHKRTKDSLEFEGNTTESGYIRPGELNLYVYTTDADGVAHRYGTKTPYLAAAGDSITFNIDTKPTPTYEMAFNITINSTTMDTTINIPIDSYMLSQDAPKIIPDGFDVNSGKLSYIEGTKPDAAAVNINAQSGIKSCVMTVNSSYLKSIGWPSSIDFFNVPADVKNILNRDGLLWTSDMTGLKLANIDFRNVAKLIKYTDAASAENSFGFTIVDNSEFSKKITAEYTLSVTPASATVSDIIDYNIWGRKVIVALSTDGDGAYLFPQIKVGDADWITPAYTSSVAGNTNTVTITGLTPETEYQIRSGYNNHIGAGSKTFTTEVPAQVGNAGFENWTDKQVVAYTIFGETLQLSTDPWNTSVEPKWWDTNNSETTKTSGTPAYLTFKCFPMVTYVAGRTGAKAAQIMAIAVNGGNTSGTSLSNAKPGYIFLGTYGGDKGHSFSSRPSSMTFYYKYLPRETDTFRAKVQVLNGTDVIGSGEITPTFSSEISAWTEADVNITYTVTDKKATSIQVEFYQSTSSKPNYKMNVSITYCGTNTANVHGGSILTIDDITLNY